MIATLDLPAPVLLDASLSPDGTTLHFAWERYHQSSVVIDGVEHPIATITASIGTGDRSCVSFGSDTSVTEATYGVGAMTFPQTFVMGGIVWGLEPDPLFGQKLLGQLPGSNTITVEGPTSVAPLAAAKPQHGKGHK